MLVLLIGNGRTITNIVQNNQSLQRLSIFLDATGSVTNFATSGTFNSKSVNNGYIAQNLVILYDGKYNTRSGYNTEATTWQDLSGNDKDATLDGGYWQDNGVVLDGLDDGVFVGSNLQDIFSINNTIEIKVKFDELNSRDLIFGNYPNTNNINYEKYNLNNDTRLWVNGGNYSTYFGGAYTSNTDKYTLTYVWNKTEKKVEQYINGILRYTFTNDEIGNYNFTNFTSAWIGRDNRGAGNVAMKGTVYSFRVYNRNLTGDEITNNYNVDSSN